MATVEVVLAALRPDAVNVLAKTQKCRPAKSHSWTSCRHGQGLDWRLRSQELNLSSSTTNAARRATRLADSLFVHSTRTNWIGESVSASVCSSHVARPTSAAFCWETQFWISETLKSKRGLLGAGRRQKPKGDLLVVRVGSPVKEAEVQDAEKDSFGGAGDGNDGGGDGRGDGDEGGALGFVSNGILIVLWAGLIYYAAVLAPGQTPYRDQYFLEKLCGLKGDDGFSMNPILVDVFYIMGLWPAIYTALLIPSGRSSKGGLPVWPFAALSTFVGVFGLLPYFAFWKPPVPIVFRKELETLPFKVLESKIFAAALAISMAGLLVTAGLSSREAWAEYLQYFRESKFIHVMSIDFVCLSLLAPFWVYNDLSVRQGLQKKSWLLPLALLPAIGPALHLLLRPSLPSGMVKE